MNKYLLINCYSDNNKGDLGIILSTIDYINCNDSNADISGVSTYNYADPFYSSEHVLLRKKIAVYPSIFGELNIGKNKSIPVKLVRFVWDTIRILLFLSLPLAISSKILFSSKERTTLNKIIESDYIVSKGGSFLCNEPNFRSKMALVRFTYIFLLSFKLNKKVIILNQSIGPVYGKLSIKLINYLLQRSFRVVLREDECVKEYNYLSFPEKTIVSNDIAFYLTSSKTDLEFPRNTLNIGVTMKYVDKDREADYRNMWVKSIEYILLNYNNSQMYIFDQVPISNDLDAAWIIYKKIADKYKNRITFISNNYDSSTLKYLYGQMDLFIGTRLHSTIFAMGELVPTIAISYHGTKAEGVFENMSFGDYVVKGYEASNLIDKFNLLYNHRANNSDILKEKLLEYRDKMDEEFQFIFS